MQKALIAVLSLIVVLLLLLLILNENNGSKQRMPVERDRIVRVTNS